LERVGKKRGGEGGRIEVEKNRHFMETVPFGKNQQEKITREGVVSHYVQTREIFRPCGESLVQATAS